MRGRPKWSVLSRYVFERCTGEKCADYLHQASGVGMKERAADAKFSDESLEGGG